MSKYFFIVFLVSFINSFLCQQTALANPDILYSLRPRAYEEARQPTDLMDLPAFLRKNEKMLSVFKELNGGRSLRFINITADTAAPYEALTKALENVQEDEYVAITICKFAKNKSRIIYRIVIDRAGYIKTHGAPWRVEWAKAIAEEEGNLYSAIKNFEFTCGIIVNTRKERVELSEISIGRKHIFKLRDKGFISEFFRNVEPELVDRYAGMEIFMIDAEVEPKVLPHLMERHFDAKLREGTTTYMGAIRNPQIAKQKRSGIKNSYGTKPPIRIDKIMHEIERDVGNLLSSPQRKAVPQVSIESIAGSYLNTAKYVHIKDNKYAVKELRRRIAAHLEARGFSRVPDNNDWYSLPEDPALERETQSSILRPQAAGERWRKGRSEAVGVKVEKLLKDRNKRPEPHEIEQVSTEEMIAAAQAMGIDRETIVSVTNSLTFAEVDNVLPYIYEMANRIVKEINSYARILVVGRDAEIFYDALKTLLKGSPAGEKIMLFPGSITFMSYLNNLSFNNPTLLPWRVKFLEFFGITPLAINEKVRFLILDTGFMGSVGQLLCEVVYDAYDSEIPYDRNIRYAMPIRLVDANYIATGYDVGTLKDFNAPLDDLRRRFPKTTRIIERTQKDPNMSANYCLASVLQLLPHYHEEYAVMERRSDGRIVAIPQGNGTVKWDIDSAEGINDSIVNPFAAMLVQKKVIDYFNAVRAGKIARPLISELSAAPGLQTSILRPQAAGERITEQIEIDFQAALAEAIRFAIKNPNPERNIFEKELKRWHAILAPNLKYRDGKPRHPGEYKYPEKARRFLNWFYCNGAREAEGLDPLAFAQKARYILYETHCFEDGHHRLSDIFMAYILARHNVFPDNLAERFSKPTRAILLPSTRLKMLTKYPIDFEINNKLVRPVGQDPRPAGALYWHEAILPRNGANLVAFIRLLEVLNEIGIDTGFTNPDNIRELIGTPRIIVVAGSPGAGTRQPGIGYLRPDMTNRLMLILIGDAPDLSDADFQNGYLKAKQSKAEEVFGEEKISSLQVIKINAQNEMRLAGEYRVRLDGLNLGIAALAAPKPAPQVAEQQELLHSILRPRAAGERNEGEGKATKPAPTAITKMVDDRVVAGPLENKDSATSLRQAGVWFDNEEIYLAGDHTIYYFDDGRVFLEQEFSEVAKLIQNPVELHKFLQGLYAERQKDMARFDYSRSHDILNRVDDTPLSYARRNGLFKEKFGSMWASNTQSFRRHIATNGREHIAFKIPGEKLHGMHLVDDGNYVISGTIWNEYGRSSGVIKPICEVVFPPGRYKNYPWESEIEYTAENPYRIVIFEYIDGIRLNTLKPDNVKYFAERLHLSDEEVIESILRQVFEIAEKIHSIGFSMMQLYLPVDDAGKIDRSRMSDASLLTDLHAGNFIVSLTENGLKVYHVSDFESTNTVELAALKRFLSEWPYRLDQLHVFVGGFTENGKFIESRDIQLGDVIIPVETARKIALEVVDKYIAECDIVHAASVVGQLRNVEALEEDPLDAISPASPDTGRQVAGVEEFVRDIEKSFFNALQTSGLLDPKYAEYRCIITSRILRSLVTDHFKAGRVRVEIVPGYHKVADTRTYHQWLAIYVDGGEPNFYIDAAYGQFESQYKDRIIVAPYRSGLAKNNRLVDSRAKFDDMRHELGVTVEDIEAVRIRSDGYRNRLVEAYDDYLNHEAIRRGETGQNLGPEIEAKIEEVIDKMRAPKSGSVAPTQVPNALAASILRPQAAGERGEAARQAEPPAVQATLAEKPAKRTGEDSLKYFRNMARIAFKADYGREPTDEELEDFMDINKNKEANRDRVFPGKKSLKEAAGLSYERITQAASKYHGQMRGVREKLGYRLRARPPEKSLRERENVLREIYEIMYGKHPTARELEEFGKKKRRYGTPPTSQKLGRAIESALKNHHGGVRQFFEGLGFEYQSDLRVPENFLTALYRDLYKRRPSPEQVEAFGKWRKRKRLLEVAVLSKRVASAAQNFYGGLGVIASHLGFRIGSHRGRSSLRNWKNYCVALYEFIYEKRPGKGELEEFMNPGIRKHREFPKERDFPYYLQDSTDFHGGYRDVAMKLGFDYNRSDSSGLIRVWKNLYARLVSLYNKYGYINMWHNLTKNTNDAINRYHGGLDNVKRMFLLEDIPAKGPILKGDPCVVQIAKSLVKDKFFGELLKLSALVNGPKTGNKIDDIRLWKVRQKFNEQMDGCAGEMKEIQQLFRVYGISPDEETPWTEAAFLRKVKEKIYANIIQNIETATNGGTDDLEDNSDSRQVILNRLSLLVDHDREGLSAALNMPLTQKNYNARYRYKKLLSSLRESVGLDPRISIIINELIKGDPNAQPLKPLPPAQAPKVLAASILRPQASGERGEGTKSPSTKTRGGKPAPAAKTTGKTKPSKQRFEPSIKGKRQTGVSKRVLFEQFKKELQGLSEETVARLRQETDLGERRRILMAAGLGVTEAIDGKFLTTALEQFLRQITIAAPVVTPSRRNILRHVGAGRYLKAYSADDFEFVVKMPREPDDPDKMGWILRSCIGEGYKLAGERLNGLAAPTIIIDATDGSKKPFSYILEKSGVQKTSLAIVQKKVVPVLDQLKYLAKEGKMEEAKRLIDKYKAFVVSMFRRGVVDLDYTNHYCNYGMDPQSGEIYVFDMGELAGDEGGVDRFFEMLNVTNKYFYDDLSLQVDKKLAAYFWQSPLQEEDFYTESGQSLFGIDLKPENMETFRMTFHYSEEDIRAIFVKHSVSEYSTAVTRRETRPRPQSSPRKPGDPHYYTEPTSDGGEPSPLPNTEGFAPVTGSSPTIELQRSILRPRAAGEKLN